MEEQADHPADARPNRAHWLAGIQQRVSHIALRIPLSRWLRSLSVKRAVASSAEDAKSRTRLGAIADLVIPVVGMYVGQYLMRAIPKATVWGMAVIGLSLALLILRLRPATAGGWTRWVQMALGLLTVTPLALNVTHWKEWTPTWQLVAVWLASCFFVISAAVRFKAQPIRLRLASSEPFDWRDGLVMVLLVAGALLLRVPNIETIPLGVDPDEASLALSAVDAATGAATDPFATGWATHPTLQFFINGEFIKWFGRSFLAMRLPWAIAGSLMVAGLYLLARAAFGRRVALIAGVLGVASNVAIQYSRLGINNMGDALFTAWVLAALWLAGSRGSAKAYAFAGFTLGFAQYFYFGSRAIPFVVVATVIVWLVADWRGVLRAWQPMLGGFMVVLVVGGPLFGHWLTHPGSISEHLFLTLPFSPKMQEEAARLGLSQGTLWWYQIRDSLLVFTSTPDRGTFYHPGQAMLHPAQAPLFLIGLLAIVAGWRRRPAYQALVAWILVDLILGSILITDAATFHRLLGVLPAAILVVAIGIDAGLNVLQRAAHWSPRTSSGLAAVVVAALVVMDIHFYFGVYNVHQAFKPPTQEAVSIAALEYEHAQGQGTFLLYTNEGVDANGTVYHSQIGFVAGDKFKGGNPMTEALVEPTQPAYFYFLPDRISDLQRVMDEFPGGTLHEYHRSSDGLVVMTRYAVMP